MTELLEALMVLSFGISWPASILKSYRARTAKGKSLFFLCMVLFGYACGIVWKCIEFAQTGVFKYPSYFYILNFVMICVDLILYYRNTRLDKMAEEQKA